ncbi:hypothetical protein NDU88_011215 [Pleurodeles waltl]|uniref:Uncharacterized protein n=1 Tax=Pleurodeles waltl TaxID=8319 RepID=A0AAV7PY79_PLEWA|nr:hypothetical protein NDU88_011215 [Pleurodeles waltl]
MAARCSGAHRCTVGLLLLGALLLVGQGEVDGWCGHCMCPSEGEGRRCPWRSPWGPLSLTPRPPVRRVCAHLSADPGTVPPAGG